MRFIFFKSLNVKRKTSVITLEHEDTEISRMPDLQARAISVLLGGYNMYGRNKHGQCIDLKKHRERVRKLWELVDEVCEEIHELDNDTKISFRKS